VIAPEAPTITAAQGSCIWTIPTPNTATGFSLGVSVNGGPFTSLTTVDATVGTYVHNGLTLGSSYQYRITADNKVGYTRTYVTPAVGYPVVTSGTTHRFSSPRATTSLPEPSSAGRYFDFSTFAVAGRAFAGEISGGWNSLWPACQSAKAYWLAKFRKVTVFSSVKCPLS